ncbi:MAG: sn-glycerol-3-phosphate ABC transporter ATP-binding protein UgpC [Bacilli bacterium]|nr:sn-glycerol-3-phosphate ABC transporter ATP-binding protein UgpC [Bacilli bacterium]
MGRISLQHVYKIYPGASEPAVKDFTLEIHDKEFVVFVGPSGCGKSTTLRMIAGLEEISKGDVYIDERKVNKVEPRDRDIAMVFQNYALYPYMTVYENMSFSLRLHKVPKKEIEQKVLKAAKILGIESLLRRKPAQLSGGQRQRVALGRAIVREPKVFLLDEPLSNLDAKMRAQMRTEITKLHNELQTTFVYVTHDQTEAMTMGTRIVVMKDGVIQQVDTPENLYDYPNNQFVAGFIGTPQINFITVTLLKEDKDVYAKFGKHKVKIDEKTVERFAINDFNNRQFTLGIRAEDIYVDEEKATKDNSLVEAKVLLTEKLGNEILIYSSVNGKEGDLVFRSKPRVNIEVDDIISLRFDTKQIHLFDYDTGTTILKR